MFEEIVKSQRHNQIKLSFFQWRPGRGGQGGHGPPSGLFVGGAQIKLGRQNRYMKILKMVEN